MIVCICRNINETLIKVEAERGKTVKEIIKLYNCNVCKQCNEYIKKIVDDTNNTCYN